MIDFTASQIREDSATRLGTRFLIFPQPWFIPGYERPEVVWVSTPPHKILPGPADARVYVTDPILAKAPYGFPYLPPFVGDRHAPAEAGPEGHFDHLEPGSRQFLAAHAFACVRRVLDICESYIGGRHPWFFLPTYDRLEVIPWLQWSNAQCGYGFLELGEEEGPDQQLIPFALNFDVVAHETAHALLFNALGLPREMTLAEDYLVYHEAVADFSSLICLLHFDSALDRILRRTRGNLFLLSELDRIAETTEERQIRVANHSLRQQDVGNDVHDRARPLVGALYDSLIYIFQRLLVERGISELNPGDYKEVRREIGSLEIGREFGLSQDEYELIHYPIKSALIEARDAVASIFFGSWSKLDAGDLSLQDASEAFVITAEEKGGRYTDTIIENLVWRGLL